MGSILGLNDRVIEILGDVGTIKGVAYEVPNGTLVVDDNDNGSFYLNFIPKNSSKMPLQLNVFGFDSLEEVILQRVLK